MPDRLVTFTIGFVWSIKLAIFSAARGACYGGRVFAPHFVTLIERHYRLTPWVSLRCLARTHRTRSPSLGSRGWWFLLWPQSSEGVFSVTEPPAWTVVKARQAASSHGVEYETWANISVSYLAAGTRISWSWRIPQAGWLPSATVLYGERCELAEAYHLRGLAILSQREILRLQSRRRL